MRVAVIERPSTTVSGLVAITVPTGTATTGSGLVVELPPDVVPSADTAVTLARADGRPLPSWIRFSKDDRSVVLSAVPDGGLPIQLALTVGGQRVVVQISEDVKN